MNGTSDSRGPCSASWTCTLRAAGVALALAVAWVAGQRVVDTYVVFGSSEVRGRAVETNIDVWPANKIGM